MPDLPTPVPQAPDFAANPLMWAVWHLEQHPELYREFRKRADLLLLKRPADVLSADMILHVIRYETLLRGTGDVYKINNNLQPLYARLYLKERPGTPLKLRRSWLDDLSPAEEARLERAFGPLRDGRLP